MSKSTVKCSGLPIASALRARRKRMGLTLQELANKSGLSAPFLSQVERDHTTPSITSLIAIAQALEVDIHYFISPPPPSQVVRRASDPELLHMGSAIRYERLTGRHGERQMEALLMSIKQARRLFGVCRDRGWLRDDLSFDEIVETVSVLCSVETYLRVTHHDGWTRARYRKWLRRMLAETVFR